MRNRLFLKTLTRLYLVLTNLPAWVQIPLWKVVNKPVRWSISKLVPNPTIVGDVWMYHDTNIASAIFHMMAGVYEPEVVSYVSKFLQPGMTFVDIGAHCGHFTLIAAKQVGREGRVYAFEPDPRNVSLLEKSIAKNNFGEYVEVVPIAVVDEKRGDSVELFLADSSGLNTILGKPTDRHITVPATTLDRFFSRSGWHHVDLIKIDIEGMELEILDGISQLSLHNPTLRMIIESSPKDWQSNGITAKDVRLKLNQLGFTRLSLIESCYNWTVDTDFEELPERVGAHNCHILCEKTPA